MVQHIPAGMPLLSPGSQCGTVLAQPWHSLSSPAGVAQPWRSDTVHPSAPLLEELLEPDFAHRRVSLLDGCSTGGCPERRSIKLPAQGNTSTGTAVSSCKTQVCVTHVLQDTDTTMVAGKRQNSGYVLWSSHCRKPSSAQRPCPPRQELCPLQAGKGAEQQPWPVGLPSVHSLGGDAQ